MEENVQEVYASEKSTENSEQNVQEKNVESSCTTELQEQTDAKNSTNEEIDESNITENVSEMSENVTEITEKNQVLCVTDKLSNLNFEVEKSRTPDETVSESFAGTFSMKKKQILRKYYRKIERREHSVK